MSVVMQAYSLSTEPLAHHVLCAVGVHGGAEVMKLLLEEHQH